MLNGHLLDRVKAERDRLGKSIYRKLDWTIIIVKLVLCSSMDIHHSSLSRGAYIDFHGVWQADHLDRNLNSAGPADTLPCRQDICRFRLVAICFYGSAAGGGYIYRNQCQGLQQLVADRQYEGAACGVFQDYNLLALAHPMSSKFDFSFKTSLMQ